MKRFFVFAAICAMTASCFAADRMTLYLPVTHTGKTYTVTSDKIDGYVESIAVNIPISNWTGTVTVATSYDTIFSGSITSSNAVHPRIAIQDYTNVTYAASSASLNRVLLCGDKITVSVLQTGPISTNRYSVPVTIWLDNK